MKKSKPGIPFINQNEKVFMDYFNKNWVKFMDDPRMKQSQIGLGNRLRPRLVFWSFIAEHFESSLSVEQYEKVASLAACMELIHKSTILLDDWIDKDDARHGLSSFHIQYSPELMVMYALNILSKSLTELNNLFFKNGNHEMYHICMNTLTETMRLMTQGEIYELTLEGNELYSVEKIQKIIRLETAELLTNSLLMGYYGGGGINQEVADTFRSIGYGCGYIFQCMNDLEPFCLKNENIKHKGNYNLDYDRDRKNIGIAILYQVANTKDRKMLESKPSYDELILLFEKYEIIKFFLKDLNDVDEKNIKKIRSLEDLGIDPLWCQAFIEFITNVVSLCKSRLGEE